MNVVALHQIEVTSRCNLRCVYCTHPTLIAPGKNPLRMPMDMPRATFQRALEWVRFFVRQGTQRELNLAGIGESTLHPELVDFVKLAREAVGEQVKIIFATNGLAVTRELAEQLAPFRPEVWVSMHRPEKGALANKLLRDAGIAGAMSMDGAVYANDWAGQVEVAWKGNYRMPCQWIRERKAFVMSDGRVSRCCLDSTGAGVIGHVDQPIGTLTTGRWALCDSCYQDPGP